MDIKMVDIPKAERFNALHNIEGFAAEFPDRIGPRDCCAYRSRASGFCMWVYRTNGGMIVARGERQ